MTRTRRSRTIRAAPQRIWELIEDPYHQPRWWPGVQRMEGVSDDAFTQVHVTKKGRPVRIDFTVIASEPPWRRIWQQEIGGTPFERVLGESVTEIALEPAGERTTVTIELRQQLRGYSRTGGFLLRRATGARLDEALEALERACGG
ncbi:MAG TPA: SRPBCC family protein [Solirubrobacteraceae bacterium]|nr:SRPBCC family protein [Solirubrobacteraceae bacterium]